MTDALSKNETELQMRMDAQAKNYEKIAYELVLLETEVDPKHKERVIKIKHMLESYVLQTKDVSEMVGSSYRQMY